MTRNLEELAFSWMIESESDLFSPQRRAQLEAWLKADIRNRIQFARARRSWHRADSLAWVRPLHGTEDPDLLMNLSLQESAATASGQLRHLRFRRIAYSLSAAAALCAVLVGGWACIVSAGWDLYSTGIGAAERFPLPDGTFVRLNTDTRLEVRVTHTRWEFRLIRGEVLIEAAQDRSRPLQLVAGRREFSVDGARFDVRLRDSKDVELVVAQGRVEVRPVAEVPALEKTPLGPAVVSANYFARFRPGTIHVAWLAPDDLARKMSWVTGVLDFEGETVAEAVSEFNRYNRRQIEITNPSIAERRVGGLFMATNPDSFVAALRYTVGVDSVTIGGEEGPRDGTLRLSTGTP